ncbi:MAG TPA: hypothetical protein VF798_04725 [Burkholderiaceae bacterium]
MVSSLFDKTNLKDRADIVALNAPVSFEPELAAPDVIHGAGFDSVSMLAIDEDWSALRFRRVEFIKPK